MPSPIDVQRNRLRRLRLLQFLYEARPERLGEGLLYTLVQRDLDLASTPDLVRESLYYLSQRSTISLATEPPFWSAQITANGIDFLEGEPAPLEGIAHPREYLR
jgi:hypothetical protein